MRNLHCWEQLRPEEFYAEFERAPVVYWAAGTMEEHGTHNALGADPYSAYAMCLRAAEITGGIVLPPVVLAPPGIPGLSREQIRARHIELYPPSLWVSREACKTVYSELLESMADLGFHVACAVGGHYPSELLLQEIMRDCRGRVGQMRYHGCGTISLLEDVIPELVEDDPEIEGHGMMWETSLVMAAQPEWVDLSLVIDLETWPLPSQLKANPPAALARIAEANPQLGEHLLLTASQRLAATACGLLYRGA